MTPEEKAKELVEKFKKLNESTDTCFGDCENVGLSVCSNTGHGCGLWITHAKQCALIAVDEIIHCTWKLKTYKKNGYIAVAEEKTTEYWQQVKQAIEKM